MLCEVIQISNTAIKRSNAPPPTSIPASSYIFFLTVQMDCKTQFKCRLEIVHSAELPNRKENKEYGALSSVLGWPCLILILHRLRMKTGAEWLNKTKQKKLIEGRKNTWLKREDIWRKVWRIEICGAQNLWIVIFRQKGRKAQTEAATICLMELWTPTVGLEWVKERYEDKPVR